MNNDGKWLQNRGYSEEKYSDQKEIDTINSKRSFISRRNSLWLSQV